MKLFKKLTFYWKFPYYIFIILKYKKFDFSLDWRGFYWDKRSPEVSQKSGLIQM